MNQPRDEAEQPRGVCVVEESTSRDPMTSRSLTALLAVLIRYIAPGLAAVALVLVLVGERVDIDDDLHLIAPSVALPGTMLPLRALLYTQLAAPEGPVLKRSAVDVRLESPAGQLLAQTRLQPAHGPQADLEGTLRLPTALGLYRLRAQTQIAGRVVRVQAPLRVLQGVPVLVPEERRARALQQFAAGPIIAEPGQTPPAALQVRVRGGACVPEQPCRVLVHVGAPAAALHIEANSTLTPSAAAAKASAITDAIVAFDFVTHGPEAELWLSAERDGKRVARRAVRLPVAMGSLSVQADAGAANAEQPRMRVYGGEGACIVDAFAQGRWLRTGSLAACQQDNRLPFSALIPGLYRVQVRGDVFSAQTAAVASVYIRKPSETPEQTVVALASAARALEAGDPFVQQCLAMPASGSTPEALGYLHALLESGVFEPPRAATSYAASATRVRERQVHLRNLSLFALLLGGLSLVLHIGRRGMSAGARAREFLAPESLDPEFSRRTRLRSLTLVVASVLSLVLVFVVIALYVLARGGY